MRRRALSKSRGKASARWRSRRRSIPLGESTVLHVWPGRVVYIACGLAATPSVDSLCVALPTSQHTDQASLLYYHQHHHHHHQPASQSLTVSSLIHALSTSLRYLVSSPTAVLCDSFIVAMYRETSCTSLYPLSVESAVQNETRFLVYHLYASYY